MKISIVVPLYNVEHYIAVCLQSVMRQTYQGPLECILVDDCGADGSMSIAEGLIAEYDGPIEFRVLHHEHNRGLSAARNTGMNAAKGDYVYFLDSDDWISDDCIEKLTKSLLQDKVDIVVGDYEMIGGTPNKWIELLYPEGIYHEKELAKTFCNAGVYVMAWNKLYCKEFLLKNHLSFEEGKIHEDEILAFELSCIEKSFYVVRSVTYYYRIRENSIISGADFIRKANGYIGVLQSVKEKVKTYNKSEGIYDFYFFEIKRVFGWITNNLDEDTRNYIDKLTDGYIDVIPNLRCLQNKHNRLIYWACRKQQTYSRYQYVTNEYANELRGRLVRKLLGFLPYKAD